MVQDIYIYILDEIVNYNMSPKESFATPFPDQDEFYSLRNNMLDERNPKIDQHMFKLYFQKACWIFLDPQAAQLEMTKLFGIMRIQLMLDLSSN